MSNDTRTLLEQPKTAGDLVLLLQRYHHDTPLAVRNAPLPTLYELVVDGEAFIEFEIPDGSGRQAGNKPRWERSYTTLPDGWREARIGDFCQVGSTMLKASNAEWIWDKDFGGYNWTGKGNPRAIYDPQPQVTG